MEKKYVAYIYLQIKEIKYNKIFIYIVHCNTLVLQTNKSAETTNKQSFLINYYTYTTDSINRPHYPHCSTLPNISHFHFHSPAIKIIFILIIQMVIIFSAMMSSLCKH